jgi:hypothetical protein
MAAQDDMKLRRDKNGKTHASLSPDRAVKICKKPVLGLTIHLTVC